MSVSSVQSGYSIIQQSQKMADEAANDIRESSSPQETNSNRSLAFNDADNVKLKRLDSNDVEPYLKLNQASQYSRVGTNVVQREQDMIGNLLDLHI